MKDMINAVLGAFDLRLTRKSSYETLLAKEKKYRNYELAETTDSAYRPMFFENLQYSKAQLRQDLFVLSELGFKRGGFFVEFGATNGVDLSNTYLLETRFGWNGILAEPAKKWHVALECNRKVNVEHDCVWKSTGEKLMFNEVSDGELSTLAAFSTSDHHRKARRNGARYEVESISLADLLDKFGAPREIDYLSIDTEGSEFEILNAFDFSRHKFRIITCEHNFTPMREQIYTLLTNNGYNRKLTELSLWDDWYVLID